LVKTCAIFGLLSVLAGCGVAGGTAQNHAEATGTLIPLGVVQVNPANILSTDPRQPFLTGANLASLGETHNVLSEKPCDGAAGSLLPPLAITQCSTGAVLGPVWMLEDITTGFTGRTIALRGLEQHFVHQEQDNLCWAAALETARSFLGLSHISHLELVNVVANDCPKLASQSTGAEMFQIAYTVAKINRDYDRNKLNPHWCSDERCIVQSMARNRPVIALISSHAVLIQAIEIASGTPDSIRRYYILDPAKDGRVEPREALDMCRAAGFVAL
jgi:hypothetical protein